jgi:hypothetical protein
VRRCVVLKRARCIVQTSNIQCISNALAPANGSEVRCVSLWTTAGELHKCLSWPVVHNEASLLGKSSSAKATTIMSSTMTMSNDVKAVSECATACAMLMAVSIAVYTLRDADC